MFGKRLVALRKQKGISQYDLAYQLDLSRGQLSNYELGTREPDFATLRKLAQYFDVSADYLLGFSDTQKETELVNDMFSAGYTKLPVLSTIRTGTPILADENISGYIDLPDYIRGDFILAVKGDRLIGAGILDGDLAICCKTEVVDSGQIVVALNDIDNGFSEVTLKCYSYNDEGAVLRSTNPNYTEMNRNDGYMIAGAVVSLIRKDVTGNQVLANCMAAKNADEWSEVIDLATQAGLKVHQVKEILAGQVEIAKRLRGL